MSAPPSPPVRRPRAALWHHLFFAAAICVCCAAGWFELGRARQGRVVAWVYAAEWPAFAVVFVVMWWQVATGHQQRRKPRRRGPSIPDDDPGLKAWRAYLDELGHDGTKTDRAPGSG